MILESLNTFEQPVFSSSRASVNVRVRRRLTLVSGGVSGHDRDLLAAWRFLRLGILADYRTESRKHALVFIFLNGYDSLLVSR